MPSCLDPCLKWSTELLRPALEIGCGVAQTRVGCGVAQTRVRWGAELLRPVFEGGTRSCSDLRKTRSFSNPRLKSMFPFGREVNVLVEM